MATTQQELTQALIGGHWTSGGGEVMEVRSPYTGELVNEIPACNSADVDRAVKAARAAQPAWGAVSLVERVDLLRRMHRVFLEAGEDIAQMITREVGKTISQTREEVFEYAAPAFQKAAEEVLRHRGQSFPSTQERSNNKRIVLSHRPLGVIGVITPYNFPTDISSIAIAHAIGAGNTIIWKPSEFAATSCAMVGALFAEAGLPPGVVNLVQGLGEVGASIVEHPDVDGIFFTGSTATGEQIASRAGLKRTLLELGGDGPQIVLADADVDAAVEGAIMGCFYLAGQCCTSAERILVHEDVHDEFVQKLRTRTAELKVGDPADPTINMGPLCNRATLAKVVRHVDQARLQGAQVEQFGVEDGLIYPPTLLTDVTPDMEIAQHETFGPVAPIIRVASTEQAIEIANASDLGLTASVYTRDLASAWRVGEALQHGTVNINESTNYWDQLAPFGGAKKSGVGRELSQWFLDAFTEPKLLTFDLGDAPKGDRHVLGDW